MRALSIDSILSNGWLFDWKNQAQGASVMSIAEIESAAVSLFEELALANVDYLLVGGIALLSYVPGRNTQDVDLLIHEADLSKIPGAPSRTSTEFGQSPYHGIRVDLLLDAHPLFLEVITKERSTVQFRNLQVPVATREGLLLLKLFALPSLYRQGQHSRAALYEADVRMLCLSAPIDMSSIFARLSRHVLPSDLVELKRIVAEQSNRGFSP
jgi:hypothetical protein